MNICIASSLFSILASSRERWVIEWKERRLYYVNHKNGKLLSGWRGIITYFLDRFKNWIRVSLVIHFPLLNYSNRWLVSEEGITFFPSFFFPLSTFFPFNTWPLIDPTRPTSAFKRGYANCMSKNQHKKLVLLHSFHKKIIEPSLQSYFGWKQVKHGKK